MTVYPLEIDSDSDIIRISDNITELGSEAINQLRDAVFAIEQELGIQPSGSMTSVAARLNISLNANGTLKTSAIASAGLVTLPISDIHVGVNAGIKEYKLSLDYSTSDLNTRVSSNTALLNALSAFVGTVNSDLNTHIAGGSLLTNGDPARHVASHIDLNATPQDSRDLSYVWSGLLDKNNSQRSASTVAQALLQINNDFVNHQNAVDDAHQASAINIDTDDFQEVPQAVDTVQKLADHIDDFEVLSLGDHRATQHANCIPQIARVTSCTLPDGYAQNIVPNTPVLTFLVTNPNIAPVDSVAVGDDIVSFKPIDNSDFSFDSQFCQVQIGDVIRINYGQGYEASFTVESIRFTPGSEWIVRINGTNLLDTNDGYASARIDRPTFDRDTYGILAVAAANAAPTGFFDTILQSVIVANPRSAVALGNGFDANQLDASHYNLYLELYPTGNPADRVISMPAVDVTGNAGTTPGRYTLDTVIHETNKKFREIGYNYRFIAFAHDGNFGVMLADAINCASFSITSGSLSTGTLTVGLFTDNVIGDADATGLDALGLGSTHAALASPAYGSSFPDTTAAQLPTKVIVSYKRRNYIVDGQKRDDFAPTWMATEDVNGDGYWDGYISDRTVVGAFTVETTYTIDLDLKAAGLKPGKTIVVQPAIALTHANYHDVDYGRFIIKSVIFPTVCAGYTQQTLITVISGIHAEGTGVAFSSGPNLAVKLYFSEDSVDFDHDNVIDSVPTTTDYHRLHEIFINSSGKTFSHARARMPVQNETGVLLGTNVWHIENVSPKLRGYRDDAVTFNKYIRFYILSFDTTTGEYDGYIGQRDPSSDNILSVGPVTRGRKNVPTRFYDETHVDYIDLVFEDESPTLISSLNILSDGIPGGGGTPRYVDIEVFDSLQLNDNLMLLATVEVNWDPVSGQEVIQRVTNRREFGSIDEEDFTESAIDFITAGDRALHENGIIRGFGFDYINSTDDREIFYKGGVAVVNGRVVTTNAISVTIPEISEHLALPLPDYIDWAVCINENGYLEPILITSDKQQFFAIENTSGATYYVPSVTFAELVETRKDLVPIAIVTATIASITINDSDVLDVRRFIDDGKGRDLVYSPLDFAGTFHTPDALKNWVNAYASTSPVVVKVRGTFDVTSAIDLTGFTSQVIFDGDGGVFDIASNQGILFGSNVSFRNIRFNYALGDTPPSFTADDIINIGNGCLYNESGAHLEDVTIENCHFYSEVTTQRPPFINIEKEGGEKLSNVRIINNKFDDTDVALPKIQAAIAIIHLSSGGSPALVMDTVIADNKCNLDQGIYLVSDDSAEPGLATIGVQIRGNTCGIIGFANSTTIQALSARQHDGLIISNNTCCLITNTDEEGSGPDSFAADAEYPTGSVLIDGNFCNFIDIRCSAGDVTDEDFASAIITNNHLQAVDTADLKDLVIRTVPSGMVAVSIRGSGAAGCPVNERHVTISNNSINKAYDGAANQEYTTGIMCTSSALISGNVIRGLDTSAYGILLSSPNLSTPVDFLVENNKIYRGSNTISAYVYMSGSASNELTALIVDNYFDSPTIDIAGLSTDVITYPTGRTNVIATRNKNQTCTTNIGAWVGTVAIGVTQYYTVVGDNAAITASTADVGVDFTAPTLFFNYDDVGGSETVQWIISLEEVIPLGVTIISISCDVSITGTATVSGNAIMSLNDFAGTATELSNPIDLSSVTSGTCRLPNGAWVNTWKNDQGNNLVLSASIQLNSAATRNAFIDYIALTYRW